MPSIHSGTWMLDPGLLVFGEVCILAEGNTPLKVGFDSSELLPTLFSSVYLLLMWTLQSPCLTRPSQTTFLEPQPPRTSSSYTLLFDHGFYHSNKKKVTKNKHMPSLKHFYSRLKVWAVLSQIMLREWLYLISPMRSRTHKECHYSPPHTYPHFSF